MPRHVIERLSRHLTVYDIKKTNINTATIPVLHAFCARGTTVSDKTMSEDIYEYLHETDTDILASNVIKSTNDTQGVLEKIDIEDGVIQILKKELGVQSDIFHVGIYVALYDTETGVVQANSRVQMIYSRQSQHKNNPLLYYREG